jgi:trehalose 6-phosphate synthase/phosphatase
MELKLHPDLKGPLRALCEDERTTVIVLSGSDRSVLDEVILRAHLCYFRFG